MAKQNILNDNTTWGSEATKIESNFTELYNNKIDKTDLDQSTGADSTNAMSQAAVTNALAAKSDHGYLSDPKTLKEVEDNLVQLEGKTKLLYGKIKNLLPYYAINNSVYLTGIYDPEKAILTNDPSHKKLGIRYKSTGSASVKLKDVQNNIEGKYVIVGVLMSDSNGVFKTNDLQIQTSINSNRTSTTLMPNHSKGVFDIDENNKYYWSVSIIQPGNNGKYLWLYDKNYGGTCEFWSNPFIAISDSVPNILNIEMFLGEEKLFIDEMYEENPLLDQIKAKTVADYIQPTDGVIMTSAIEEITDVLPSGNVLFVGNDPIYNRYGYFKWSFGDDGLGKYGTIGLFIYNVNGLLDRPAIYNYNGLVNSAISLSNVIFEKLSDRLTYYQASVLYTDAQTQYGLTALLQHNRGSVLESYIFGAMGALTDYLPVGKKLKPVSWNQRYEIVKGYGLNFDEEEYLFKNKKMVWMGTSIPAGGGYPAAVGAEMGADIVNIALGGGAIRAFKEDGSWFSQTDLKYKFTLKSSDIQERYGANLGESVNPNDYSQLQEGGVILSQGMLDALIPFNYENILIPHLDAEIFVIDYGINDRGGQTTFPFQTADATGVDRKHLTGAIGFIVQLIDAYKKANNQEYQIVYLTHHNRTGSANDVVEAQINTARYYGGKLINLADNVGLNALNLNYYTDGLHFGATSFIAKRIKRYIVSQMNEM